VVAVIFIAVAIGAVIGSTLLWTLRLPPTRPRPGSRSRGHTLTTIDRELRQKKR